MPLSIMTNYFSLGVDASIALRFHTEREKFPEKFSSRMKNKVMYGMYGSEEMVKHTCADLEKNLEIIVDGRRLEKLPALEGIAVLNINSMYGGSNLWGTKDTGKWRPQMMDDGLFEVVGLYGAFHVGQVKGGLRQSAKRLAQGSNIQVSPPCFVSCSSCSYLLFLSPPYLSPFFSHSSLLCRMLFVADPDAKVVSDADRRRAVDASALHAHHRAL